VRVVEYEIDGLESGESIYRLVTNILETKSAPALELAALYHERWEIENAFDELKVHLRGREVVLRSKTPDLVKQELYGLLLAHFAVRGLMYEAADSTDLDADDLSFVHALRIVRRRILNDSFPPSGNDGTCRDL
jgi:IS4 transposase